ncbi:MAG: glycosyltransferase family 39 protein [Anaerolineales bacterium]
MSNIQGGARAQDTASPSRRQALWHGLALAAILVVALGARLYRLDTLPPGLYRDEAVNGLDALRILDGEHPLYFTANNGREPLYMYLLAASVGLLGRTPGALRLVSALLGTATVLASYWLGRELYGRRLGLILATVLATAVWPLNLSRIALRAGSLPLFSSLFLAALWHGLRQHRLRWLVLAGVCWGLSFYTYLAARFTLVAVPLLAVYLWRVWPQARWRRGWLVLVIVAALVAAPLGGYVLSHWADTMGRVGQVSVFDEAIGQGHPWRALARNIVGAALGPFVRGDFIPRHNVPLRPAFGVVLVPFGLLGLVLLARRVGREAAAGLCLGWCAVLAIPTVLAENAPHFLRAVGVLPVLYLLPAVGLDEAARWLARRWQGRAWPIVLAGLLVASGVELSAYGRHLQSEAVYYNFESGATALAAQINRYLGEGWPGVGLAEPPAREGTGRVVALDTRLRENWPSLDYLLVAQERVITLDAVHADTPTPLALAVWPYGDTAAVLQRAPKGQVIDVQPGAWERGDLESEARLLYTWIEVGATAEPAQPLAERWAGGPTLDGYTLEREAGELRLALWWRAEAPIDHDYTVFCQAIVDGALVGQADGPPALGLLPTSQWNEYAGVIDRRTISVDNDATSRAELYVGLYDLATMQRLPLLAPDGEITDQTYVVLR